MKVDARHKLNSTSKETQTQNKDIPLTINNT
jgi:hypothetical protein